MSNTKEVSTPKGIEIPADKLMSVVLERSISDKDQTIGAHKQTIEHLKVQNKELQEELSATKAEKNIIADDQKVVVVSNARSGTKVCPNCGYENGNNNSCYDCGYSLRNVKAGPKVIEYRNMDSVIADIRKEEAKSLKIDNVELEKRLGDTEFKFNKTLNELKKTKSESMQQLTDAKREVRERYQKEIDERERKFTAIIDENEKKIDELVEEIQKLEENKTDAEVEEARKQEIVDLKSQVEELNALIEEAKEASTPRMKKFWNKVADRKETLKLEEEKEAKQRRVDQISNSYPNSTIKGKPWWKKGKYAKNTADSVSDANESRGGLWNHIMGSSSTLTYNGW